MSFSIQKILMPAAHSVGSANKPSAAASQQFLPSPAPAGGGFEAFHSTFQLAQEYEPPLDIGGPGVHTEGSGSYGSDSSQPSPSPSPSPVPTPTPAPTPNPQPAPPGS